MYCLKKVIKTIKVLELVHLPITNNSPGIYKLDLLVNTVLSYWTIFKSLNLS